MLCVSRIECEWVPPQYLWYVIEMRDWNLEARVLLNTRSEKSVCVCVWHRSRNLVIDAYWISVSVCLVFGSFFRYAWNIYIHIYRSQRSSYWNFLEVRLFISIYVARWENCECEEAQHFATHTYHQQRNEQQQQQQPKVCVSECGIWNRKHLRVPKNEFLETDRRWW